ncbi:MAG TPA: hypothetical protein VFL47_14615, partial [Flavisolibacter sp.]|nr:hypothetical protein [Flavisolibacter sp.]
APYLLMRAFHRKSSPGAALLHYASSLHRESNVFDFFSFTVSIVCYPSIPYTLLKFCYHELPLLFYLKETVSKRQNQEQENLF